MTEGEVRMFTLGKKTGREEVIEELKRLLGLDECPHCKHRAHEHD